MKHPRPERMSPVCAVVQTRMSGKGLGQREGVRQSRRDLEAWKGERALVPRSEHSSQSGTVQRASQGWVFYFCPAEVTMKQNKGIGTWLTLG